MKKQKIVLGAVAAGIVALLIVTVLLLKKGDRPREAAPDTAYLEANVMKIETQHGEIVIEFYPDDAPKTVARIKELVSQGFYNGLTFHRVEPGFVVQGGDPDGRGTGGSGKKLPAEFNSRKHEEGTVAMARAGHDVNSADSQFYIALGTFPHLDGSYTVFGHVRSGMDAVKKIRPGDKMIRVTLQ